LVRWQIAHKGPTLDELEPDWENHDRFIAPSYLNVGGGASVSFMRSADIHVLWMTTVSGKNGAHRARMLAVGASWSFGGGLGAFGRTGSPQRSHPLSRSFTPRLRD
jgi:hypothetical protein